MNDSWLKDIMTQRFLNSDLTRLIIIKALTRDNYLRNAYKKIDVVKYIYQTYSDYEEFRNINPDPVIRNILRYGLSDIKYVLDNALNEWCDYASNNVLRYDERYIYLNGIYDDYELCQHTKRVMDMLTRKYFSLTLTEPQSLDPIICKNDLDLEKFGKSTFRNRVLEDIQYCPLCEETDLENLYAVHILESKFCTEEEIVDKSNGILMCKEHAKDYIDNRFCFKENGFVYNINSEIVTDKMHLAISVKNQKRREYLKRKYMLHTKEMMQE